MEATAARAARPDDGAAIAAIYNQGIEDRVATFETELRTAAHVAAVLAERLPTHPALIAERDGGVVAFAWTSPYSSRPCYAGIGEFSVYVRRDARGSGVGRLVLGALITACERRGFWKLTSRIFPENAASRRLCAAHGFREVGVHHQHARLDGAWRDVVIVERLLGAAAAQGSVRGGAPRL
jgi:phosphinothricin acetyltransferase